eukprot:RCo003742
MSNPQGMDLQHGVVHQSAAVQGGVAAQEAGVRDLLDGLPDGQHQGGVDERHHNVLVKLVRVFPLHGPHGVGHPGKLGHRQLRHAQPVAQDAQCGQRPSPAECVHLRVVLADQVHDLAIQQGAQRIDVVDEQQVAQSTGLEQRQDLLLLLCGVLLANRHVPDDTVVFLLPNALELVKLVVAKLRRGKQEARPQHDQRGSDGDGVKVLDLHLLSAILRVLHRYLVNVTVLRLHQEEEHVLLLVCGVADNEQAVVGGHVLPPWDHTLQLVSSHPLLIDMRGGVVLEGDVVLGADQHAPRAVRPAGHGDQEVAGALYGGAPLPKHVVQAQIQLVIHELLRGLVCIRVLVKVTVINLQSGERGVVKAHVDPADAEDNAVGLVRLQGGGDRQARGGVAIQDVDELLFLYGGDHQRSPTRIHGKVLPRNNPAATRLPEGL